MGSEMCIRDRIWAPVFVAPPGVLMDIAAIVIHPAELAHDVAAGALKYRPAWWGRGCGPTCCVTAGPGSCRPILSGSWRCCAVPLSTALLLLGSSIRRTALRATMTAGRRRIETGMRVVLRGPCRWLRCTRVRGRMSLRLGCRRYRCVIVGRIRNVIAAATPS